MRVHSVLAIPVHLAGVLRDPWVARDWAALLLGLVASVALGLGAGALIESDPDPASWGRASQLGAGALALAGLSIIAIYRLDVRLPTTARLLRIETNGIHGPLDSPVAAVDYGRLTHFWGQVDWTIWTVGQPVKLADAYVSLHERRRRGPFSQTRTIVGRVPIVDITGRVDMQEVLEPLDQRWAATATFEELWQPGIRTHHSLEVRLHVLADSPEIHLTHRVGTIDVTPRTR